MPMSSIIEENMDKLESDKKNRQIELERLINTKITTLWSNELESLKNEIQKKKIKLVKSS